MFERSLVASLSQAKTQHRSPQLLRAREVVLIHTTKNFHSPSLSRLCLRGWAIHPTSQIPKDQDHRRQQSHFEDMKRENTSRGNCSEQSDIFSNHPQVYILHEGTADLNWFSVVMFYCRISVYTIFPCLFSSSPWIQLLQAKAIGIGLLLLTSDTVHT